MVTMLLKHDVLVRRLRGLVPLVFLALLLFYALWPWLPVAGSSAPRTIVFYGFSILSEVINQGVFPAFQKEWKARTGEHVELASSFAGSGTITNQLIMGVPGHLALLSLESDAHRLAAEQVVAPDGWQQLPHRGVVNRTPFIIVVRPGNPKGIHDLADLARPGIGIVHPDPLTSGGANWAIVAEYGAAMRRNPSNPRAGYDLLLGIWRNVVAQAASARAARTQFDNGFGDALITYEQEVLWDRSRGRLKSDIVYPRSTILSEHTLVEIERNIRGGERELVDAFTEFLWTETAQRTFVEHGFRSVDEKLNAANANFGAIADPFLIADFGGWKRAKKEIVEDVWKNKVLKELGK